MIAALQEGKLPPGMKAWLDRPVVHSEGDVLRNLQGRLNWIEARNLQEMETGTAASADEGEVPGDIEEVLIPDSDAGEGSSDSSSVGLKEVFGDLEFMGEWSAEAEQAITEGREHDQFLGNLQDLLDLAGQGLEVRWPKGLNLEEAKGLVQGGLPPKLVERADIRFPSPVPSSPVPFAPVSPVVCKDTLEQETVPSSSSSSTAPVVVEPVQAKPVKVPSGAPKRAAIRQRFAFGNVSEETARIWTHRDSKELPEFPKANPQ